MGCKRKNVDPKMEERLNRTEVEGTMEGEKRKRTKKEMTMEAFGR